MRRGALHVAAVLLVAACSVRSYTGPREARFASEANRPVDAEDDGPITVVTFNVQRAERVGEAIAELRSDPVLRAADIVLLQEMDAEGARAVARALRMHHVYYPSYVQDGRQSGAAVLSRFSIRSDRAILLPYPNPFDRRRRRAVRAVVETPRGPLLVYSVHVVPALMSIRGRRGQARHVLDDAARFELPAIIGGDFNTLEPRSVRRVVQDHRIRGFDWATRGLEATADYVFGSPRLDHVFVRGLEAIEAGAPRTEASDHRPVWVRLRFVPDRDWT